MKRHNIVKGVQSELTAQLWLLEQGYWVFDAIESHSPIDLVAVKGDEHLLIDVKSTQMKLGSMKTKKYECRSRSLTQEQKDLGVKLLYVYEDGRCEF